VERITTGIKKVSKRARFCTEVARKNTPQPPGPEPELRVSRQEAAEKIDDRITKGRELLQRNVANSDGFNALDGDYKKWDAYNRELLGRLFTTDRVAKEYSYAGATPVMMTAGPPTHAHQLRRLREYIDAKIGSFESIKERLQLFPMQAEKAAAPSVSAQSRAHTNRAFIVHGHHDAARETVARFLHLTG
jgi:hypothetical protein